jgi:hypothetical protein
MIPFILSHDGLILSPRVPEEINRNGTLEELQKA